MIALNTMTIRDRRHADKRKQTMSLAGFVVAPPIGVASRSGDLMFGKDTPGSNWCFSFAPELVGGSPSSGSLLSL